MGGIVWIASYPKSGNTWMRAFLANLFRNDPAPLSLDTLAKLISTDVRADLFEALTGKTVEELSTADIKRLRPQVQEGIAAAAPGLQFVKTHSLLGTDDGHPTISMRATAGVIYIVRNPLDVASSFANHLSKDIDGAIRSMGLRGNVFLTHKRQVYHLLGSWSEHVLSWTGSPGLKRHVVRYEDMLSDPRAIFGEVTRFLTLPEDPARLDKAIRFSGFDILAEKERQEGFQERPDQTQQFFRQGKAGAWRRELSDAQVAQVIRDQGEMMRRFGYLGDDGTPLA